MSGDGKEPGLDLESNVVEFGPVLPHSLGEERSVVFRNSSQFPIEIYSVEFDSQYIEEERVSTQYYSSGAKVDNNSEILVSSGLKSSSHTFNFI